MGRTSEKFLKRLSKHPSLGNEIRQMIAPIQRALTTLSRGTAIWDSQGDAIDPLHNVYTAIQNATSFFAERFTSLPEFTAYYQIVDKAENEYMPSAPPMSPLTKSYFTTWAFFDVRFGRDRETLGSCLLHVSEELGFGQNVLDAIRAFSDSRMGIYESLKSRSGRSRLRELITDIEYDCVVTSGYQGRNGELLYVRLCRPLEPVAYHVVVTTPYILLSFTKADWTDYLNRSLIDSDGPKQRGLAHFLKYGREPNQWNEFIFQAYANYQFDAIFLTGLPDVPSSLPHAPKF
jgi:hypothetical protein